jgi:hypothetical protein
LTGAPVNKIFTFMAEPNNLPEIWPSLLEVKDVEFLPNGGSSYNWGYQLAEPFIVKQNKNEVDVVLANLKARMEV